MKTTAYIEFSKEVDVEVTMEDLQVIMCEPNEERLSFILSQINSISQFLKAIPDERIREMTDMARYYISEMLIEQLRRYDYQEFDGGECGCKKTEVPK